MTQNTKFVLRATTAAALLALGTLAMAAAPTIDANIELDSTYNSGSALNAANNGGVSKTGMDQGGRLELNISQKAGTDYFVAGRATLLAKKDGTAGTDDLWAQLGSNSASVKLGRFEAADLFPVPQDTVVNHAAPLYYTNALRGRSEKFHAAGMFNTGGAVTFELGLIDATDAALGSGTKGVRPVISYASGALSLKAGAEVGKYLSGRNLDGSGFTAGYTANGMGFNLNLAQGKSDADSNNKMNAIGVNALFGPFFIGYITGKNENGAAAGDTKVDTVHASYNIPIFGVTGASITPAISHSTAKNSATGVSQDVDALRVRVHYDF